MERVELLAHSRGSALLLDALRELFIDTIAFGDEPAERLKVDNIVLMAPDIDVDVAVAKLEIFNSDPDLRTRRSSVQLPTFYHGRLTIYASPEDRACTPGSSSLGGTASVSLKPSKLSTGKSSGECTKKYWKSAAETSAH